MKKATQPSKVKVAFGEQLSFLPIPAFCPQLPPPNSAAAFALDALLQGDLTQIDWLQRGHGWRLAATIKELDYLGWCPVAILVSCSGWARPIARYSLPIFAKQAFYAMRKGGGHA